MMGWPAPVVQCLGVLVAQGEVFARYRQRSPHECTHHRLQGGRVAVGCISRMGTQFVCSGLRGHGYPFSSLVPLPLACAGRALQSWQRSVMGQKTLFVASLMILSII
ncbi:hypothetical protein B0H13DRAFT_2112642 [Mycena leptocephala]|nr:hypothetical protein B0H13DRAFT_2112642 [Mycena leptocephala]